MRNGIRAVLVMGFGTLVALIAVLGFSAFRRANRIESEIASIHENYRQSSLVLNQIKEGTYRSGITLRDYLLDPSPAVGPKYRQELLTIRNSVARNLESLAQMNSRDEGNVLGRLAQQLDEYWNTVGPVFEWTPKQKERLASPFLTRKLIPQRNSILSVAHEIDELSQRTLQREQEKINLSRMEFQKYLREMLGASIILALGVAIVSIFRVSALEKNSEIQRGRAAKAETELRRLSQQLVQAQEEERKSLSRELHDEIGQMLTGLKMELANLEEFRNSPGNEFKEHLIEAKTITEQTMRSVRELAMGLRPSMLDDLGLEPALRWQTREFSRHSGVPVSLIAHGDIEHLSEAVRTCIYRIVQESLTNCGRHAQATSILISVSGEQDHISLTIEDNGRGFDPAQVLDQGLGLIGMEERIKKLGGSFSIISRNSIGHKGTVVKVELPHTA